MNIARTAAKFFKANDIDGAEIAKKARAKYGHNAWMCALAEHKVKPPVKPVEEIKPEPIQTDTRKIDMRADPIQSGRTASGTLTKKSKLDITNM